MFSGQILRAIEDATAVISRLDVRISASPLAEAWQVRACFIAAENLSAVDGTGTRFSDILGLALDAKLACSDNYLTATVGFGHWRRCRRMSNSLILRADLLAENSLGRRKFARGPLTKSFSKHCPIMFHGMFHGM